MRLILLAALPQEYRHFLKQFKNWRCVARKPFRAYQGRFQDRELLLVETGMGSRNLSAIFDRFLAHPHADAVISMGFAGALRAPMETGQVIVGARLYLLDDTHRVVADPVAVVAGGDALSRWALDRGYPEADLISVSSPREKTKIHVPSPDGWAATDMESAHLARIGAAQKIPMVFFRSISDRLDHEITFDIQSVCDQEGRVRILPALSALAKHPEWLPAFYQSWKRAQIASASLASSLLSFLTLPHAQLDRILSEIEIVATTEPSDGHHRRASS